MIDTSIRYSDRYDGGMSSAILHSMSSLNLSLFANGPEMGRILFRCPEDAIGERRSADRSKLAKKIHNTQAIQKSLNTLPRIDLLQRRKRLPDTSKLLILHVFHNNEIIPSFRLAENGKQLRHRNIAVILQIFKGFSLK
ncbi:hypothetical protein MPH_12638 [Macrophomina phaseolina MS6]|uniref:Uncharacterized protein n=1 Tax=Macrophomina phaseolina (strain MS6) TaxID=1126212 RepID=K2QK82_MACPH|nr:hypothetical protein MPH_12638 [Macrophomina phaseolina MS6]